MKQSSQNKKTVINLFDFASRKSQNTPTTERKNSIGFQSKKSSLPYGFDTLLHFNDSLNLSSIKPHQGSFSQISRDKKPSRDHKYQSIIAQAKEDADRLKQKRIEHQALWKNKSPKKANNNLQAELDQSLAQSQVTSYNLYESKISYQPTKNEVKDIFVLELKEQIKKGKIILFVEKIKQVFSLRLVKELKVYNNIADFRKKWEKITCKMTFLSWKDLVKQLQSRRHIRQAIIKRIKQRKETHVEEEYLQNLLKD